MKAMLTFVGLVLHGALFAQSSTVKEECTDVFWGRIDTTHIDTITTFKEYCPCITRIPERLFDFSKLERLLLDTGLDLEVLSPKVHQLQNLEVLVLQKTKLKVLPNEVCQLPKLRRLSISWGGALEAVPDCIGDLKHLEYLNLYRNELKTLPESIADLTSLTRLVLGENQFSEEEQKRIIALLPNCKITFDYNYLD